ncbi:MAG: arginine deiminase-related protein [Flavobacteriales bacterium]
MHATSAVILIRPTGFGYDPGTAATNAFQRPVVQRDISERAAEEFDTLLAALRSCGIRTTVLDPVDPAAPNAVFPNNWFSTHADGTVVVYPMLTPSRRSERDPHLRSLLEAEGFCVERVVDLSAWERDGRILEGTGSLVLDRSGHIAYACLSPRTTPEAVDLWCAHFGFRAVPFNATMDGSAAGAPIYHTNVVMALGTHWALVCLDALPAPKERRLLQAALEATGRTLIPFSLEQMHQYLGNALELQGGRGPCVLLSATAFAALHPEQRRTLERFAQLVPVAIPTIEAVGGGSVRCMLAENFLPQEGIR